ncbi:MAG: hypothetical protein COW32_03060 [Candidatus Aquicultor secundus]|uniref:PqqD family protein n=1 Tax=Candidatus Aquicultor secundus TaxID=1973895 RepID=A0A2M7TAB5_9ACTN|nr:PqqD family protein [Candidatus Aquicultor secundus]NCO65196.1 PqqD family protein [Solirubrobacter sp.]OIO87606.1 MAG: hypothetical protein AUK32_03435 [Candidatus Aquicultor secundus]PIU28074.1 MAG: hypothetical protein COT10_00195 [Candidatus Aquicultor secundus]PIW22749.1 MAG: hypothetical protein COW32_03060 [Candidatus Aquicultor secundus]PIX53093.1 MAG: hypothetical protein COZ51_00655 [Candidatus Aquicultor secundus]
MEESTRLIRNPDLVFRVVNEEGVIYNPRTQRLHMLNATALMAWHLWDGDHSLLDIVNAVISEYEADPQGVMNDISLCAKELCRHGLLSDSSHTGN